MVPTVRYASSSPNASTLRQARKNDMLSCCFCNTSQCYAEEQPHNVHANGILSRLVEVDKRCEEHPVAHKPARDELKSSPTHALALCSLLLLDLAQRFLLFLCDRCGCKVIRCVGTTCQATKLGNAVCRSCSPSRVPQLTSCTLQNEYLTAERTQR